MTGGPVFATLGQKAGDINVRLSHKTVKLFSEGLYTSPNKAVEELVANSFDAGARTVHVLTSLGAGKSSTIAVIDDGEGMDGKDLRKHWIIGRTNKRKLASPPMGRKQIGKFGIGKLATYVLANRLTHISRRGHSHYSTSMDYGMINNRTTGEVEAEEPVTIPWRRLTAAQAKQALSSWADTPEFQKCKMSLFGKGGPKSWTASIMSDLKPMAHEIEIGRLAWVLRTALPLRPDFAVWLDGVRIRPSKEERGPIKRWIIGKDVIALPKPGPRATKSTRASLPPSSEHRFGLDVDGIGRITGHAEMYENALVGKSDNWGRSSGFFVYARGRLLNEVDGHFGIQPNELRHGTFSRFRAVVHMDGLDDYLRSSREAVGDGKMLCMARDILRGIFNMARKEMDKYDRGMDPDARLASKVSAGPASLSRRPIAALARAVAEGKARSRHLSVPSLESGDRREALLASLEQSISAPESFITGREMDNDGDPDDVIAKFDCKSRRLRINAQHPFVTVFDDEFDSKKHSLPLELFVMGDVVAEARMYQDGLDPEKIDDMVVSRDRLLRYLAYVSGRQSPPAVASALECARTPKDFEKCVCDAFRSLGFEVQQLGGRGEPDGVAVASLAADDRGAARRYAVSIEAKSKADGGRAVPAKDADISAVASHCRDQECDHAVIVGPAFQTSRGRDSSFSKFIADACKRNEPSTITLVATDDLTRLVRLRPIKQVGLEEIRGLFRECRMPEESARWIDRVAEKSVTRPPYRKIIGAIAAHQKEFPMAPVRYAALHILLAKMEPPVRYDTSEEIAKLCKAMDQMSEGAIWAHSDRVELDQSEENAIGAIEAVLEECERGSRKGGTSKGGGRSGGNAQGGRD